MISVHMDKFMFFPISSSFCYYTISFACPFPPSILRCMDRENIPPLGTRRASLPHSCLSDSVPPGCYSLTVGCHQMWVHPLLPTAMDADMSTSNLHTTCPIQTSHYRTHLTLIRPVAPHIHTTRGVQPSIVLRSN